VKTLLLIRGDTTGWLGAIRVWWHLFHLINTVRYRSEYGIRTIAQPSPREAVEALAVSDAAIFYGHGEPGAVRLGRGLRFDKQTLLELSDARAQNGAPQMDFVQISCCDTCSDPAWVELWLNLTKQLRGYTGATYSARNPFVIPDCLTFKR